MRRFPVLLLMAALLGLSAGCAHDASFGNAGRGEVRWTRTELYFGLDTKTGVVTEAQWARFVDQHLTPAFPDGLSIDDLHGQWRGPDGVIVRERSKLVTILHPHSPEAAGRIDAVREAYKAQFDQDSVMKVQSPARVGF